MEQLICRIKTSEEAMSIESENLIRRHYKEEAQKHGASLCSTMEDEIVRNKELELILNFFTILVTKIGSGSLKVLDLGCGNGYVLSVLSKSFPANIYWGLDFTKELLSIAKNRELPNCKFIEADACSLPFDTNYFDVIYSERCLINILDWEKQKSALYEINRVLKPSRYYLMIECFTDGLINNNKARQECGLSEIKAAYHNKYFEKDAFFEAIKNIFNIIDPGQLYPDRGPALFSTNFLSSHYFIARVLHPLVTKGEWKRNTEFVKFFSFLPPFGNYSPIQAYILQKK